MDEKSIRKHLHSLGVGPLIKQRDWLNAPCPLAPWRHRSGKDRKPSFGVHVTKGQQSHYYCFTCKATGRLPDLAADLGRLRDEDYSEIAKEAFKDDLISISSYEEVPDVKVLPEPLDPAVYGNIYDSIGAWPEALEYLEERGITRRTAMKMGLMYDEEEKRIVFAVYDRKGRLFGFSGRSILKECDYPDPRYPKVRDYFGLPKQHLLLGEERCENGKPMLVVEGLIGFARMFEIGADEHFNIVALLGSVLTDKKAERLLRWNEAVWLLPDDDEAGDVCLWGRLTDAGVHKGDGAIDKLYDHVPVYVPEYPEGVDDVDDFEPEDIEHIMDETEPYILS